jgi:hypothetical protein
MAKAESPGAWDRRQFISTAAAAAAMGLAPSAVRAQGGPWAQRPPGAPGSVTFVVWQYGKIYEQIAQQFEDDWSSRSTRSSSPTSSRRWPSSARCSPPATRSTSRCRPCSILANYIDQGIAQPIDGLPGVEQYVRDFTPFTRRHRPARRQDVGAAVLLRPVWTFMYNDELLAKAGFKDKPFRSYPELVEQARKAKKRRRGEVSRSSGSAARASSSCRARGSASPAIAAA